jgi:RNA polymerase subunit RPABC4/transcription elongation factor Spt4
MKLVCIPCQKEFESDSLPTCPQCRSSRGVHRVVTLHMITESPQGEIASAAEDKSRSYFASPLCGTKQIITRNTRDIGWTCEVDRVNCPECLKILKETSIEPR